MSELQDALDLYDNPQFIIIQSASPELRTIIAAARKWADHQCPSVDEADGSVNYPSMKGMTLDELDMGLTEDEASAFHAALTEDTDA